MLASLIPSFVISKTKFNEAIQIELNINFSCLKLVDGQMMNAAFPGTSHSGEPDLYSYSQPREPQIWDPTGTQPCIKNVAQYNEVPPKDGLFEYIDQELNSNSTASQMQLVDEYTHIPFGNNNCQNMDWDNGSRTFYHHEIMYSNPNVESMCNNSTPVSVMSAPLNNTPEQLNSVGVIANNSQFDSACQTTLMSTADQISFSQPLNPPVANILSASFPPNLYFSNTNIGCNSSLSSVSSLVRPMDCVSTGRENDQFAGVTTENGQLNFASTSTGFDKDLIPVSTASRQLSFPTSNEWCGPTMDEGNAVTGYSSLPNVPNASLTGSGQELLLQELGILNFDHSADLITNGRANLSDSGKTVEKFPPGSELVGTIVKKRKTPTRKAMKEHKYVSVNVETLTSEELAASAAAKLLLKRQKKPKKPSKFISSFLVFIFKDIMMKYVFYACRTCEIY